MAWDDLQRHLSRLSAQDIERIKRAFDLGKEAHGDQLRKSGEPYFNHPTTVAAMLADMGADADTIIAALLHDTIEDTTLPREEIDQKFNGDVLALVEGVTKLKRSDVEGRPALDEQIETIRKMFTAMEKDVRIMVIKLVDRLHNMQTIWPLSPERRQALAQDTRDVYVKIADRLCMQDVRDELEGLCIQTLDPELWSKLQEQQKENDQRGRAILPKMEAALRSYEAIPPETTMLLEPKTWEKVEQQMRIEGAPASGISAATVVIICADHNSCYRMMGALHAFWKRESMSFQDFINAPQINGYRGLHTTVILEDGTRVRCKIRTQTMHEYARQGVTTRCFDAQAKGALEYLSWTERISPLTGDNTDRSAAFWESLQSDILGDSIILHGPADETVHLPTGATALDGAFFLFHTAALRAAALKIDGRTVPFSLPLLENGKTLTIVLDPEHTVQRDWLRSVRTGYATASIRSALVSTQSEEEKLLLGRDLLQKALDERRRGYIQEFDEEALVKTLKPLGFRSLEDAYLAIAEGKADPTDVHDAMFAVKQKQQKSRSVAARFTYRLDDLVTLSAIAEVYKKHSAFVRGVRMWPWPLWRPTHALVTLRMLLAPSQEREFMEDLRKTGAGDVRIYAGSKKFAMAVGVVLLALLWGFDPVISHWLLARFFTWHELTIVRFSTMFVASALMYWIHNFTTGGKFQPLNPLQPTLMFAGLSLFATGVLSYLVLSRTSASVYIIFVFSIQFFAVFLQRLWNKNEWMRFVGPASLLVLNIILLSLAVHLSLPIFLLTLGSGLAFSGYSILSDAYQEENISARYPAYLFWVSITCLALSLVSALASPLPTFSPWELFIGVTFAFVFNFLPYLFYFELMRRMQYEQLEKYLFFIPLITLMAESALSIQSLAINLISAVIIFIGILTMLTASLPSAKRQSI
jgi:RelA/SpoT family (p)ppGpp synthetase